MQLPDVSGVDMGAIISTTFDLLKERLCKVSDVFINRYVRVSCIWRTGLSYCSLQRVSPALLVLWPADHKKSTQSDESILLSSKPVSLFPFLIPCRSASAPQPLPVSHPLTTCLCSFCVRSSIGLKLNLFGFIPWPLLCLCFICLVCPGDISGSHQFESITSLCSVSKSSEFYLQRPFPFISSNVALPASSRSEKLTENDFYFGCLCVFVYVFTLRCV